MRETTQPQINPSGAPAAEVSPETEALIARNARLSRMKDDIIELLGSVIESRNEESGLHIRRVKDFTRILAEDVRLNYPEYGLTAEDVETISSSSALHDIGKIMISDAILLKPGKLTPDEFELMQQHTIMGCILLEKAEGIWDDEYMESCYEICRSHHERWDGKGYPDGLSGDDIPISAQIVGIADVYDALVTERCYKKPFTTAEAYKMITGGECGTFSPKIMEAFIRCRKKMEAIVN